MWRRVTREEMYEQVWSVPIWTLCEQYGLSDNGLRKVCRRLNVPVPPRGYWAKVEAGKKVRKAALPKDAKMTATEIWCAPKREKTPADEADVEWLKESLEEEAEAQRRAVLAAERAEAERVRQEEERVREEERRRREALVAEAVAWRRAAEIRPYVAAVRAEVEKHGVGHGMRREGCT